MEINQKYAALIADLKILKASAEKIIPSPTSILSSIEDHISETYDAALDEIKPLTISDVRRLPTDWHYHAAGHLICSLDTTMECGDDLGCDDEENPDPDYICMDWWLSELLDIPEESVIAMVASGTVETPQEPMAWIESQAEQAA